MDLESRILAMEATLGAMEAALSEVNRQLSTSQRPRSTRLQSLQETLTGAPAWAELQRSLTQLSSDLRGVREELARSSVNSGNQLLSPASIRSAQSPTALPALWPGVTTQERLQPPPAHSASPLLQTPDPSEAQQAAATTSTGDQDDRSNHSANVSLANLTRTTAGTSPLTDLGSNIERVPQHASFPSRAEVRAPDESPAITSMSGTPTTARSKFSLTTEEMGEKMVASIAGLVADDKFTGRIRVIGLDAINWDALSSKLKGPEHLDQLGNEYFDGERGKGYSYLKLSGSSRFELPDFSEDMARPSDDEALAYLDEVASSPPKGPLPYYVGPPLSPDFDSLLHPGVDLMRFATVPGVNSPYWHVGVKGSGTGVHKEDSEWWSANLVYLGWKLWIEISPSHTARFEQFVRRHWETNDCAQFMRHLSLFIGPTRLREEGIDFTIHCAGPGDMIVTKPGQYHAVVNVTACFAEAINFLLPGEPVMPPDLAVCGQCGLFPLDHPSLRVVSCPTAVETRKPEPRRVAKTFRMTRRPAQVAESDRPAKKPRTVQSHLTSTQELETTVANFREIDKYCKLFSYDASQPPSPELLKLAMAIGSRPAIQQFCNIVRSRRDPNNDHSRVAFSSDLNIRIEQRINNMSTSQRRSDLEKLRIRLDQFYLAEDIEQSKDGRLKSDPAVIGNILKRTGLSKETFKHHQKWGNKWRAICRGRPALLCFILHGHNKFSISPTSYVDLTPTEMDRFHHLMDSPYVDSICTAAEAFLRSLDSTSDDVEFLWEADNMPLHELPEAKMLAYLQPLPSNQGNTFDPNDHDLFDAWPNAPWPFDTPQPPDPTMIANSVYPKCDLCNTDDCQCVLGRYRGGHHQPRIKDYGGLGRGLQAVALKMGQVAYEKGAVIGFVTGEVVPAGARSGPWALDFVRPDLDGEPIVCQIYCGNVGNCFRLLNHSCNPSAQLVQLKASGRYVTAVRADRQIWDGEQITVSYGETWGDASDTEPCLCEKCRADSPPVG